MSGVTRRKRTQPKAESIRSFAIKPINSSTKQTNYFVLGRFVIRTVVLMGSVGGFVLFILAPQRIFPMAYVASRLLPTVALLVGLMGLQTHTRHEKNKNYNNHGYRQRQLCLKKHKRLQNVTD